MITKKAKTSIFWDVSVKFLLNLSPPPPVNFWKFRQHTNILRVSKKLLLIDQETIVDLSTCHSASIWEEDSILSENLALKILLVLCRRKIIGRWDFQARSNTTSSIWMCEQDNQQANTFVIVSSQCWKTQCADDVSVMVSNPWSKTTVVAKSPWRTPLGFISLKLRLLKHSSCNFWQFRSNSGSQVHIKIFWNFYCFTERHVANALWPLRKIHKVLLKLKISRMLETFLIMWQRPLIQFLKPDKLNIA